MTVESQTHHAWQRGSSIVYPSSPPQFDWYCRFCNTNARCTEPPREVCPARERPGRGHW